jgi:flagellar assembly factor FliW
VIATVPALIEDLSINIKSPVVLNPKTRKARQVILQNPDYPVKYFPFRPDGKAGSGC